MKPIVALLLLLCLHAAAADETVVVYQLNGAMHCGEDTAIPIEQAADLLRAQGVKVLAAERRSLPMDVPALCGAPTGEANVMTVSAADWALFTTRNADAGGYGRWVFDEGRVQVYMYDGTLQCGLGQAIGVEEMAEKLTGAGIEVLQSGKDTDGLLHIAVCGASTGAINVYTINRDDLAAARRLGFHVLVTREMTQQIKPQKKHKSGLQARSVAATADRPLEPIPLPW